MYLEIDSDNLSLSSLMNYVSSHLLASSNRANLAFYSDKNHIGNASIFVDPSTPSGAFEFGWFIGDKNFWGGFSSASIMFLVFDIGFSIYGFDSCYGSVLKSNIKARIANKFVGFRETSSYQYYRKSCNEFATAFHLSLSASQWKIHRSLLLDSHPDVFGPLVVSDYLSEFLLSHNLSSLAPSC